MLKARGDDRRKKEINCCPVADVRNDECTVRRREVAGKTHGKRTWAFFLLDQSGMALQGHRGALSTVQDVAEQNRRAED
jgi:hypothetical protein